MENAVRTVTKKELMAEKESKIGLRIVIGQEGEETRVDDLIGDGVMIVLKDGTQAIGHSAGMAPTDAIQSVRAFIDMIKEISDGSKELGILLAVTLMDEVDKLTDELEKS